MTIITRAMTISMIIFLCSIDTISGQGVEQTVTIKQLIGTAEIKTPSSAQWRPAHVGMTVKSKWDIRTFVESSVELQFETGSLVKIGENSVVNLATLFKEKDGAVTNSNIKVNSGQIIGNIEKLVNKKSTFSFETPTAVAAIRGTNIGIYVNDATTIIDVFEGKVSVLKKGNKKSVLVTTRTRAVVKTTEAQIKVVTFENLKQTPTTQQQDSMLFNNPFLKDSVELYNTKDSLKVDTSSSDQGKNDLHESSSQPPSTQSKKIFLVLTQPKQDQKITEPIIVVEGTTLPGAIVLVNDNGIPVRSDGSFSYQLHIPNEKSVYRVAVVAEFDNQMIRDNRDVIFTPQKTELTLDIKAPLSGQIIQTEFIRIIGQTIPGAAVEINGRKILSATAGAFTFDLPISEKDIGDYLVEIIASSDRGTSNTEVTKSIPVKIDVKSQQINKTIPQVMLLGQSQGNTRNSSLKFQVLDNTKNDQISVRAEHNTSKDQFVLSSGEVEKITLDPGKNVYSIVAVDLSNNSSNILKGEINYLPGPLNIEIIKPDESQITIKDLPPMPSNTGALKVGIEIVVNDGIGNVPQTVLFCRANGINLLGNNNYVFKGSVEVKRGRNVITFDVEDAAGNRAQKQCVVTINE